MVDTAWQAEKAVKITFILSNKWKTTLFALGIPDKSLETYFFVKY